MLARLILICGLSLFLSQPTLAGPIYTPRDSGTEAPGGPRAPIGVPTPSNFGRTQEGGMGYTDAYGNTISGEIPETAPKNVCHKGLMAATASQILIIVPCQTQPRARLSLPGVFVKSWL